MPKQFLQLFGEESLLQATVRRLNRFLPLEDIYIVTTASHEVFVRLQLPQLPERNLIVEPMGRDTAAAIGYACTLLGDAEAESTAIVVPSDHFISNEAAWVRTLNDACQAASAGRPVLIGIPPTRPETAYGYVLLSDELPSGSTRFYRVARFIEKPNRDLAERLIRGNRCLWNSGMFIWKISTAMDLIRRHLPGTSAALSEIAGMRADSNAPPPGSAAWQARAARLFAGITPVSIDYGVLEKSADVVVALGEFGWDDVGGWEALTRLVPADERKNAVLGNALLVDAEGCIVDWPSGPAIVVGIRDAVVAGSGGRLLVCPRERLRELKGILGSQAFEEISAGARTVQREGVPSPAQVVDKPWGREVWWAVTDRYAAKVLELDAGQATSLHLHQRKHETLYFQSGYGRLLMGGNTTVICPGMVQAVSPGVPHRIFASTDLVIIEVSTPDLEDVVRLEDDYGRSSRRDEPR